MMAPSVSGLPPLSINTGLRRGEQFNLRWDHVNLANRVLTIPRSKHGGSRHVQLNDTAMAILRALPSRFSRQPGRTRREDRGFHLA